MSPRNDISIVLSLFIFLSAGALAVQAKGKVFDYDAGPQKACRVSVAKFRLWIPDTTKKINGVLIITPGRNSDGRRRVEGKGYQDLASKWGFAIMANFLQGIKGDKDTYQLDWKGHTADLLVDVLDKFADKTNHKELKTAPLFLIGKSAGGNVSVQFAGHSPKRTIGVVGWIPTVGPGSNGGKKLKVPMLVAIGAKDRANWVKYSDKVWSKYGRESHWTYAKHKNKGHSAGIANPIGLVYADTVIKQRLIPDGRGGYKDTLAELEMKWIGNLSTYEINESRSRRKTLSKDECWLPDKATAIIWKKYLTSPNGKVNVTFPTGNLQ